MKKFLILFSLIFFLFCACRNELDLVEEGPGIPIVYSLLYHSDSIHYVRINKSFNGNMLPYDMAWEEDSILFQQSLDVKLFVLNENNNVIKTLQFEKLYLKKDSVNYKGEIVFAVERHYVFVGKGDIPVAKNYSYKLEIKKNDEPIAWATTGSLGDFVSELPKTNMMIQIRSDRPLATAWHEGKNGGIVQVFVTIYYYEYNKIEKRYYIREINDSSDIVPAKAKGKAFFGLVDTLLKQIENTDTEEIEWRYIARAKTEYIVWSRDYTDYLLYNNTKNNANYEYEVMWSVTNIIGGYGIFGTKMKQIIEPVYFDPFTHKLFFENYSALKFRAGIYYKDLPDSLPYQR